MAYLDLTPMLQAMRARPSEFEMYGSFSRHIRSQHLLDFDRRGNARVHARCDCAMFQVSREQGEEMKVAFSAWKIVYWEPHLAQSRLRSARRKSIVNSPRTSGRLARGDASSRSSVAMTIPSR